LWNDTTQSQGKHWRKYILIQKHKQTNKQTNKETNNEVMMMIMIIIIIIIFPRHMAAGGIVYTEFFVV
jgi:dolichol kinase